MNRNDPHREKICPFSVAKQCHNSKEIKPINIGDMVFDMDDGFKVSRQEMESIKRACSGYSKRLQESHRFIAVYSYNLDNYQGLCDMYIVAKNIPMVGQRVKAHPPVGLSPYANDFMFSGVARPAEATMEDVKRINVHFKGEII
ncbi:MAG: hypothetical protein IJT54_06620 [Candidatus Methanomethylophilaceae archaeon]|nr:hypothetical protein [Candidatus Methanomethylophilaceae archaeon]